MTDDDLFAILAIAVVLTVVGIVVFFIRENGRKRFETLAPAFDFGTSRRVGLFGMTITGLFGGYPCRYTIQPASQYNPGGASLRLAVSATGRWSAELKNAGARMLVKIGVLQDLEIGDPDLDLRLRLTADDEGSLRTLFGVETVRTAIREVMATENFASARLGKHGLEVRWSPRDRRLDEDADILRRRLEVARNLASACGYPPRLGL